MSIDCASLLPLFFDEIKCVGTWCALWWCGKRFPICNNKTNSKTNMKTLIIKKWITCLCLAGALLGVTGAQAVVISDSRLLGTILPGTPASPENETEMVRFLVAALNTGSSGAVAFPGAGVSLGDDPADGASPEVYTLWAPAGLGLPAPLPAATGVQTVTSNTTFNLGAMQYDYIVAKFGSDAEAFWIGGLSGELTIPNLTGNQNGLSGFTLINGRTNVPDGGATVALMGLALGGLSLSRRFLKVPAV